MFQVLLAIRHLLWHSLTNLIGGWMGTTILALAVGAIRYIVGPYIDAWRSGAPTKWQWPTLGDIIAVAGTWLLLFGLSIASTIYKDHHALAEKVTAIEKEKESALRQLDQERDRNHPKFEITSGTYIIGDMELIVPGKPKESHTHFFLPVTVYNHGTPSIIKGIKLTAHLKDGRNLEGDAFLPSQSEMNFRDLHLKFRMSSALAIKGTANPIATGGQCDGFVYFLFPPGLRDQMLDRDTKYTLQIEDINSIKYDYGLSNVWPKPTQMSVPPTMLEGTR
jgi:hypothetical protein